jgi:hypothetical protein
VDVKKQVNLMQWQILFTSCFNKRNASTAVEPQVAVFED